MPPSTEDVEEEEDEDETEQAEKDKEDEIDGPMMTLLKSSISHPPSNKKYGPIPSLKLLLRAAKMGDLQSTHRAATVLLYGYNNVIRPNPRKAEELLEYAAVVLGDSEATITLAKYHYNQVLDSSSSVAKTKAKLNSTRPSSAGSDLKINRGAAGSVGKRKLGLHRGPLRQNSLSNPPTVPGKGIKFCKAQSNTQQHLRHQETSFERTHSAVSQSSIEERLAQSQLLSLTPLTPAPIDDHVLYVTAVDKAKDYLERAASLGDSSSLVLLGDLHRDCHISVKDEEGMRISPKVQALNYYITASEKQDVRGMTSAAQMLCIGDGIEVDLRRAFHVSA